MYFCSFLQYFQKAKNYVKASNPTRRTETKPTLSWVRTKEHWRYPQYPSQSGEFPTFSPKPISSIIKVSQKYLHSSKTIEKKKKSFSTYFFLWKFLLTPKFNTALTRPLKGKARILMLQSKGRLVWIAIIIL